MEFLHLEYEGGDKLYVPVSQLHVISRYTGASPEAAPLHRLGKAVEAARPSGPVLLVIGEVASKAAVQSSLRPSDLGGPPSWDSSFFAMSR